jgi:asparagine synthase (glutamine-hydrolysing)
MSSMGDLLAEAARLRAQAEVGTAGLVSGGLDSSVVVSLTRPALSQAYFLDIPGRDEWSRAELLAKQLSLPLARLTSARPDPEALDRALWHLELPNADTCFGVALHQLQLAEAVATGGQRVAMVGDGADELFLGYPWHLLQAAAEHGWPLDEVRDLGEGARRALAQTPAAVAAATPLQAWNAAALGADLTTGEVLPLLARPFRAEVEHSVRAPGASAGRGARARQLQALVELRAHAVLHADRLFMAHGVETRSPFLDYRVVELALRAPPELLEQPGRDKPALRALARRFLPAGFEPQPKLGLGGRSRPPPGWVLNQLTALADEGLWVRDGDEVRRRAGTTRLADDRAVSLLWRALVMELTLRRLREGP